ncbi:MAG: hypothetical protein U9O85_02725 [Euryarchaeota archaeon]|nr:hypothetical protein [Euryarchaeota archaeon]
MEYGGVKQRRVVVFPEKVFTREKKTLEKKIEKEKERVEKELWHFFNQAIKREMLRRGKFIVATNELNREKLSDEEALKAYKCGALPHDPASPVRA